MNILPAALVSLIVLFGLSRAQAQDLDFTKREATDPLLKITSRIKLLPESDDKWLEAKRDEAHVPPVYRRLWSRQDVIVLEPLSEKKPAQIDFSAITKENKGVLKLVVRNDPRGDFVLEILKNGQPAVKELIASGKWERFSVPFDHEEVVLKNVANGWQFEFAFIDYSFSKDS